MPNIIDLAPTTGAIRTYYLHDIDNDIKSRLYYCTAAMASVTGAQISRVRNAVRLVRHGKGWVNLPRSPRITLTHIHEIEDTLRLLGYAGQWRNVSGLPTLASYLKNRTGIERSHPCIVYLTTHCVAVSGGMLCDPSNDDIVVDIDRAPWRRKKMFGVFVLTHRVPEADIPSKASCRILPVHRTAQRKRRIKQLDHLFREAIKAETGAVRIKVTSTEVFVIRPDDTGWSWIGARDGVVDRLLKLQYDGRIRGNADEAAAYRAAMGY